MTTRRTPCRCRSRRSRACHRSRPGACRKPACSRNPAADSCRTGRTPRRRWRRRCTYRRAVRRRRHLTIDRRSFRPPCRHRSAYDTRASSGRRAHRPCTHRSAARRRSRPRRRRKSRLVAGRSSARTPDRPWSPRPRCRRLCARLLRRHQLQHVPRRRNFDRPRPPQRRDHSRRRRQWIARRRRAQLMAASDARSSPRMSTKPRTRTAMPPSVDSSSDATPGAAYECRRIHPL